MSTQIHLSHCCRQESLQPRAPQPSQAHPHTQISRTRELKVIRAASIFVVGEGSREVSAFQEVLGVDDLCLSNRLSGDQGEASEEQQQQRRKQAGRRHGFNSANQWPGAGAQPFL